MEHQDQSLTFNDMHGSFCAECGEGEWAAANSRCYVETQAVLVRAVTGDVGGESGAFASG